MVERPPSPPSCSVCHMQGPLRGQSHAEDCYVGQRKAQEGAERRLAAWDPEDVAIMRSIHERHGIPTTAAKLDKSLRVLLGEPPPNARGGASDG